MDYEKGQLKIMNTNGPVYFGIFEIDESGDRAELRIEYQENSYPTGFSSKALTYIQREVKRVGGEMRLIWVFCNGD